MYTSRENIETYAMGTKVDARIHQTLLDCEIVRNACQSIHDHITDLNIKKEPTDHDIVSKCINNNSNTSNNSNESNNNDNNNNDEEYDIKQMDKALINRVKKYHWKKSLFFCPKMIGFCESLKPINRNERKLQHRIVPPNVAFKKYRKRSQLINVAKPKSLNMDNGMDIDDDNDGNEADEDIDDNNRDHSPPSINNDNNGDSSNVNTNAVRRSNRLSKVNHEKHNNKNPMILPKIQAIEPIHSTKSTTARTTKNPSELNADNTNVNRNKISRRNNTSKVKVAPSSKAKVTKPKNQGRANTKSKKVNNAKTTKNTTTTNKKKFKKNTRNSKNVVLPKPSNQKQNNKKSKKKLVDTMKPRKKQEIQKRKQQIKDDKKKKKSQCNRMNTKRKKHAEPILVGSGKISKKKTGSKRADDDNNDHHNNFNNGNNKEINNVISTKSNGKNLKVSNKNIGKTKSTGKRKRDHSHATDSISGNNMNHQASKAICENDSNNQNEQNDDGSVEIHTVRSASKIQRSKINGTVKVNLIDIFEVTERVENGNAQINNINDIESDSNINMNDKKDATTEIEVQNVLELLRGQLSKCEDKNTGNISVVKFMRAFHPVARNHLIAGYLPTLAPDEAWARVLEAYEIDKMKPPKHKKRRIMAGNESTKQ